MAWENITHCCGHVVRHQIYGKVSERENKASWLAEKPCTECWKAEQEAKRAEENARALGQAKILELPELTGTPKQVAWATTIRAKALEGLEKELAKPNLAPQIVAVETSAKWWIENRTFIGLAPDCLAALDKEHHEKLMKIADKM